MAGYKLVVFDMDGVLVNAGSSWVVVHDHFGVNNLKALQLYLDHNIDDMEFMRRDIALWKSKKSDLCIDDIQQILDKVPMNPNISVVFEKLKKEGIKTVIVSGGIDLLAQRVMDVCGCDQQEANGLEFGVDGLLTGEGVLRVPVLRKDIVVTKLQAKYGVAKDETAAIGNSMVDVKMFESSGLGIAFDPEDREVIDGADVVIKDNDLMLLLEHLL